MVCPDCGVEVVDATVHARFHSILSSHAWALAILKTHHLSAEIHDRYDIPARIDSRKFDNWSADALAEVMTELGLDRKESEPSARPRRWWPAVRRWQS